MTLKNLSTCRLQANLADCGGFWSPTRFIYRLKFCRDKENSPFWLWSRGRISAPAGDVLAVVSMMSPSRTPFGRWWRRVCLARALANRAPSVPPRHAHYEPRQILSTTPCPARRHDRRHHHAQCNALPPWRTRHPRKHSSVRMNSTSPVFRRMVTRRNEAVTSLLGAPRYAGVWRFSLQICSCIILPRTCM